MKNKINWEAALILLLICALVFMGTFWKNQSGKYPRQISTRHNMKYESIIQGINYMPTNTNFEMEFIYLAVSGKSTKANTGITMTS